MDSRKKILGFCLKEGERKALLTLCGRESAQLLEIKEKDYGKTLGALAKVEGFPEIPPDGVRDPEGEKVSEPMLVFCGFSQEELQGFLAAYWQMQAEPVALKAMVTMYNISWTPVMLQKELRLEHKAMTERSKKK